LKYATSSILFEVLIIHIYDTNLMLFNTTGLTLSDTIAGI